MGQPHEYVQPVSIGPYKHMHLLAHVGFYDTYSYYVRGFYHLLRHHMRHGLFDELLMTIVMRNLYNHVVPPRTYKKSQKICVTGAEYARHL